MATYDCEPTMTDTEVMEFCKQGLLVLEAILPAGTNQRTLEFLDAFYATQPPDLPKRTATIPTDLFSLDWFWDNVILHPQVTGVLRTLLGRDFELPSFLSNHRVKCPMPADVPGDTGHLWHRDSSAGADGTPKLETIDFSSLDSRDGAQNCLQVFYYPQNVPLELGPTELVPGSHLIQGEGQYHVDFFSGLQDDQGNVPGSHHQAAPAGSITITSYTTWHRRTASTGQGIRNNLKYRYLRTVSPRRDWIKEPRFEIPEPSQVARNSEREVVDAADMFAWVSGREPSSS